MSPGGPNRDKMEVETVVVEQRFHVESRRADVEPITARDECMGHPFVCPTPCRAEATLQSPDIGRRLSMVQQTAASPHLAMQCDGDTSGSCAAVWPY